MHKLTCDFVVHPGLCAVNVLISRFVREKKRHVYLHCTIIVNLRVSR